MTLGCGKKGRSPLLLRLADSSIGSQRATKVIVGVILWSLQWVVVVRKIGVGSGVVLVHSTSQCCS